MKMLLSLAVKPTLLVASATSAKAQISGSYPPSPGSYSEGRYTVLENGTLIHNGDMATHCKDLARSKEEAEEEPLPTSEDP